MAYPPGVTRRHFVQQALGSAAAAVVLGKAPESAAAVALAGTRDPEARAPDLWKRVRGQFLLPDDVAYLNNGTLGPTPKPVLRALVEHQRALASDPGSENMRQYNLVEEVRAKAAAFVGAASEEIALMRNTTEGMGLAAAGLDLRAGDEVLLTFHEHPSGLEPWQVRAKRTGVVLRQLPFRLPLRDPAEILNAFDDAISPRTRAISVSHITFQTGTVVPVRELAALARSKGIVTIVDGAHALGMLSLDLHDMGADVYATSGHKWLTGPPETGLLFVRREIQERLWPTVVSAGWQEPDAGANRFDRLGQRAWPLLLALGAALDFQNAITRDRIEKRVRELAGLLRSHLERLPGVRLYTPAGRALSGGIVAFALDDYANDDVVQTLLERHRIHVRSIDYDLNAVRVSTHYYNSEGEIERLVDGLRDIARHGVISHEL